MISNDMIVYSSYLDHHVSLSGSIMTASCGSRHISHNGRKQRPPPCILLSCLHFAALTEDLCWKETCHFSICIYRLKTLHP